MNELKIRDAQLEDAARFVEIYSHYVLNTAVSFECTVPSVEEFAERIKNIKTKFPYLVCEKEDEYLTHDSQKFHLKMGYSEVAHMKGVGKKFERWYDIKWFQKKI